MAQTGKKSKNHVIVVHIDNKISYHLTSDPMEALTERFGKDKILGVVPPQTFLSNEKRLREHFGELAKRKNLEEKI